jgi:peptidoglycan/LPS O-acetylase OafA/YrhL
MNDGRPPLPAFTTFRFFAALAVVGHHLACIRDDPRYHRLHERWLFEGYSGVTFFFILSGFILAYNYGDTFRTLRRAQTRTFYVARFARVYPLHILTFFAFFLVDDSALKDIFHRPASLIANLTLTQSFFPYQSVYFSQNAVSWSLSNEFFFYALLPLLLPIAHRFGPIRPIGAVTVCGCMWLTAFLVNWHFRTSALAHWLFYVNPLFRLQDFVVGVMLGLPLIGRGHERRAALGTVGATLLECGSLAGLLAAVCFAHRVPLPVRVATYYTPFMAAVVFIFSSRAGLLSRLLCYRPLPFLGEISFSLYMLHGIWQSLLINNKTAWGLQSVGTKGFAALYLATLIAASILCYCCFETPMRVGIRALLQARQDIPSVSRHRDRQGRSLAA